MSLWIHPSGLQANASSSRTHFLIFAAIPLCEVEGLAGAFPSFPISGFIYDLPGADVPSDSVIPSYHGSSSRALPLQLHFGN